MNRFCSECGSEVQPGQAFCAECGTSAGNSEPLNTKQAAQLPPPSPPKKSAKAKKPLSFKKKLSFTLIAVLSVALIAGHYTIQARTSPADKMNAFLAAIESGNVAAMMEEIEIPKETAGDDAVYREYLSGIDSSLLAANVKEAAAGIDQDGITRIVTDENGYYTFRMKLERFLGMYPVVTIEATPVTVNLKTDLEEGKLKIAGKELDLSGGDQLVGELLPGKYPMVISTNDFFENEQEIVQDVFNNEGVTIDLPKQQLTIEVTSNKPEAILFINEESTGKTLGEVTEVGPIFGGSQIQIHAELDGVRSRIIQAVGGGRVELMFSEKTAKANSGEDPAEEAEEAEETKTETVSAEEEAQFFTLEFLEEFIWNFRAAYERALNGKDFSEVSYYLYPDSIAYKELEEFVGDLGNEYFLYEFLSDSVIDHRVEGNRAYVTTEEEFEFTNHLGETIYYERMKEYEVLAEKDMMYQIVSISILDTERKR